MISLIGLLSLICLLVAMSTVKSMHFQLGLGICETRLVSEFFSFSAFFSMFPWSITVEILTA